MNIILSLFTAFFFLIFGIGVFMAVALGAVGVLGGLIYSAWIGSHSWFSEMRSGQETLDPDVYVRLEGGHLLEDEYSHQLEVA